MGESQKTFAERDALNRQDYVNRVVNVIESYTNSKKYGSFAIDGKWGSGKTYTLEMIKEKIQADNKVLNSNENGKEKLIFSYNCWEYDYYEEPAIAIVSSISKQLEDNKNLIDKAGDVAKAAATSIKKALGEMVKAQIKSKISLDIDALAPLVMELGKGISNKISEEFGTLIGKSNVTKTNNSSEENQSVADSKNEKNSLGEKITESFSTHNSSAAYDDLDAFTQALNEVKIKIIELANIQPIIVFVDELDRCLPSYAIKVLERMHHLFDQVRNVVIIYAIDSKQLGQSVKSIFGDVAVDAYLKKFIDFKMVLDYGDVGHLRKFEQVLRGFVFNATTCADQKTDADIVNSKEYSDIIEVFQKVSLDIRSIEKIMDRIETIEGLIKLSTNEGLPKPGGYILLFEVMLCLMEYDFYYGYGKVISDRIKAPVSFSDLLDMYLLPVSDIRQILPSYTLEVELPGGDVSGFERSILPKYLKDKEKKYADFLGIGNKVVNGAGLYDPFAKVFLCFDIHVNNHAKRYSASHSYLQSDVDIEHITKFLDYAKYVKA